MNRNLHYIHRVQGSVTALLILALILSPVAPVLAQAPKEKAAKADTETTTPPDYPKLTIGPGDTLLIQVYGENSGNFGGITGGGIGLSGGGSSNSQLPTSYQVDTDGIIVFPFLGRVKLAGLTSTEASEKIAGLLSKPRKVTVLIQNSDTFWVSVLGNVAKPGKYQILGKPTVLSALAEAGGPLPDTDLGGTILLHNGFKTKINFNDYLSGEGRIGPDPYLYPGDMLMIQRSAWPDLGTIAIVASILASAAVVTVELSNLHH